MLFLDMYFIHRSLVLLDLSASSLGIEGAKHLAKALSTKRCVPSLNICICICQHFLSILLFDPARSTSVLAELNLANNSIGTAVLEEGWKKTGVVKFGNVKYTHMDGRTQKEQPAGIPEGVVALACAIDCMEGLTSVNLLQNSLDDEGAQRIADAWKDHGALTTICGTKENALDVSGGKLGADLPVVLVEIKNNKALTSVNLLQNSLGNEGAQRIADAWKDHGALTTICGTKENALDVSGGKLGADLPVVLVEIKNNKAISTVIVNTFPLAIQDIKSKAELDFSGKELHVEDVIIIAALIPSNVSHNPYISLLLSLISLSVTRGL
jgi:hypothetical protein